MTGAGSLWSLEGSLAGLLFFGQADTTAMSFVTIAATRPDLYAKNSVLFSLIHVQRICRQNYLCTPEL